MADYYPGPVCACPVMPSMWWHFPGRGWERRCELDEESDPVADAAEYNASGASEWLIQCDMCAHQYFRGVGRVVLFPVNLN